MIPSVSHTYIDGERRTFVTCIVTIQEQEYQVLSANSKITYEHLREHHRLIYEDLRLFLKNRTSVDLGGRRIIKKNLIARPLHLH